MCERDSFILTRSGKVLDGMGITHSHTEIRELHGLKNTDDTVNAYEWRPPKGWPNVNWLEGLVKDTEVFTPKSSHFAAMELRIKSLYPTMEAWNAGDKPRISKADSKLADELVASSEYITVPEMTLLNGQIVPSFKIAKYPMSRGEKSIPVSMASENPWSNITYHTARAISARVGLELMCETRALAIALNIYQQDANWTGGKVGEGQLFQGVHKGNVSSAKAGDYESPDASERSWHQLSNGERIYHFAGNIYSWVFDDVQGDEQGIVTRPFAKGSVSIMAPLPSMEKGIGWIPDAGCDWSGYALVRGGYWVSGPVAGVFRLGLVGPGLRGVGVGFRCTLPIGL